MQLIEFEIEPEYLSRDLFLVGNNLVELVSCGASVKFKTFLSRRVSLELIFYSSTKSFLDSLLVGNTFVELVPYGILAKFKTFLSRGVLLELILCFLARSFFVSFKCS